MMSTCLHDGSTSAYCLDHPVRAATLIKSIDIEKTNAKCNYPLLCVVSLWYGPLSATPTGKQEHQSRITNPFLNQNRSSKSKNPIFISRHDSPYMAQHPSLLQQHNRFLPHQVKAAHKGR